MTDISDKAVNEAFADIRFGNDEVPGWVYAGIDIIEARFKADAQALMLADTLSTALTGVEEMSIQTWVARVVEARDAYRAAREQVK